MSANHVRDRLLIQKGRQGARHEGSFDERNQYFLGCADRALNHPPASLDGEDEITAQRVSSTKDVLILRIDHLAKSSLSGVWRGQRRKVVVTLEH